MSSNVSTYICRRCKEPFKQVVPVRICHPKQYCESCAQIRHNEATRWAHIRKKATLKVHLGLKVGDVYRQLGLGPHGRVHHKIVALGQLKVYARDLQEADLMKLPLAYTYNNFMKQHWTTPVAHGH